VNRSRVNLRDFVDDPTELIQQHFVLENGRPYAGPIQLWQRRFFGAIFATNGEGIPQHRLIYDERRRGESKTEDIGAAGLADLLVGPPRHRSYVVAGDQEQAALALDSIKGFKDRSPVLADVVIERSVVRNPATDSELRVMSADAPTAYGIRPRRVYFDELSLQPDDRLWKAMWSAIGKRPTAQMVAVSMAGYDFSSIAWKVRELARSNATYYFASREGTEPAPWLSPKDLAEQRATLHPADYARFWECRWTEPSGSWITREMYDGAEVGQEGQVGDPRWRYAGFVDVGLVHDATAIAVTHAEGERGDARVVLDSLHTLQGSRAEPVELEAVEDLVADLTERFKVRHWVFEAPQAVASVQRLQQRLTGQAEVQARYPTADSQAQLFGTLYQLLSSRRLILFAHEQLRKEALSLVTRVQGGRLKVVDSGSVHQDHVVALGGAAQLSLVLARKARPVVAPIVLMRSSSRPWSVGLGERKPWNEHGGNSPLDTSVRGPLG
jgi:hypothetical protein